MDQNNKQNHRCTKTAGST